MGIKKPYHRIYRSHIEGPNSGYSNRAFIIDKDYSSSPEHYLRAYNIIQEDFKKLLEYIEPSDINLETYSYRIHELFLRVCIEIEANFKAILRENIYNPKNKELKNRKENDLNIRDYYKIEKSHNLSSYKIYFPTRKGKNVFQPFEERKNGYELFRYTAYNKSKHNREKEFTKANFNNLVHAITGLLVVLSSQFRTEDFSSDDPGISSGKNGYFTEGESAIGGFFRVEFPNDWEESEKYEFDWNELEKESEKIQKFNYDIF